MFRYDLTSLFLGGSFQYAPLIRFEHESTPAALTSSMLPLSISPCSPGLYLADASWGSYPPERPLFGHLPQEEIIPSSLARHGPASPPC